MKKYLWLRLLICLVGISATFGILLYGNLSTPRIEVKNHDTIDLDTLGNKLYLLEHAWGIQNETNEIIYKTVLTFSGDQQKYGLYLSRATGMTLLINGSSDDVIRDESHLIYLFTPSDLHVPCTIEIHIPMKSSRMNTVASFYIGSYSDIISVSHRETYFRLFIVGLSFALLLNSASLYLQKRSEKYLLPLAALVYSTFGVILLNAFPSLQNNSLINILLLGSFKFPFISSSVSYNIHEIYFPILVSLFNYMLLRNFVSIKIGKIPYLYILLVVSLFLLFFVNVNNFTVIAQANRIFINLIEFIIIIKGSYQHKTDSIVLTVGSVGTVAFTGFLAFCTMDIIPHGNIDLLFRLGGVAVSLYALAFTIAINGIFARKFSEAEILAQELQDINNSLQQTVDKRTCELKSAYDRLETELRQKDSFVTNMVHNLKTPLFSLGGYADMARDVLHTDPGKAEHFLGLINANVDYVGTMINNLFLALRLEYGRVNFLRENVNLCSVLEHVRDVTQAQSNSKGITLRVNEPTSPLMAECDQYYLTQAIQNIADNAVRHTPAGGCVELSLFELDRDIQIKIVDNGEGIENDILPHIFERYYSHTDGNLSSSGLGLSIAQDIISAHQGSINVLSKVGSGSEFIIQIPKICRDNLKN